MATALTMPQHEVKVNDRFKLGPWEWEVVRTTEGFGFKSVKAGDDSSELWLNPSDADSLDWIAPKVTISKEAARYIESKCDKDWPVYDTPGISNMSELLRSMIG